MKPILFFILITTASVVEANRLDINQSSDELTSLSFVPVRNRVVLVDYFIRLLLISQQVDVSAASQRCSQGHKKVPNCEAP